MSTPSSPYPTDFSDAEWELLVPLLPLPARRGRPLKWSRRRIVEAVSYLLRADCTWRLLPVNFPPWQTVYRQFQRWQAEGTLQAIHDPPPQCAGRAGQPGLQLRRGPDRPPPARDVGHLQPGGRRRAVRGDSRHRRADPGEQASLGRRGPRQAHPSARGGSLPCRIQCGCSLKGESAKRLRQEAFGP